MASPPLSLSFKFPSSTLTTYSINHINIIHLPKHHPNSFISDITQIKTMSRFDPYNHLKVSLNPDGTLTRNYQVNSIDANPTPHPNERSPASKDITINPRTQTWARIYCPSNIGSKSSLPIIIYFHGGGWISYNVADVLCHDRSCQYAMEIPAVVVSMDYRLAPENRLPAQYEDAVDAIEWVRKQAVDPDGEKWLRESGDFSRCYLVGRQNGANIAFNAALRVSEVKLSPVKIAGVVLNQPMFSGKQRTKSELRYATDDLLPLPVLDLMWELALPKGTDRDHRHCNPMKDEVLQQKIGYIGRCLVIGYGQDPMIDRQQEFVTMLVRGGAKVEAHFDDFGFHAIDLVDPKRAAFNIKLMKEFIR